MSAPKLRCWPGCLAITNSLIHRKENGRVVRVLHRVPQNDHELAGQTISGEFAPCWAVELLTGTFSFMRPPVALAAYFDTSLIPLTPPDGVDEAVTSGQSEMEHA